MTSDARGYTPATRDDLLPGAVFVVMQRAIRFPVGTLLKLYDDIEKDHCPRFIDHDDRVGWCSLNRLAVHTPGAAVTSHAAAAAEIARLRAEVAALREALHWTLALLRAQRRVIHDRDVVTLISAEYQERKASEIIGAADAALASTKGTQP